MLTSADLQLECIGYASVWMNGEIGDGGARASTAQWRGSAPTNNPLLGCLWRSISRTFSHAWEKASRVG